VEVARATFIFFTALWLQYLFYALSWNALVTILCSVKCQIRIKLGFSNKKLKLPTCWISVLSSCR